MVIQIVQRVKFQVDGRGFCKMYKSLQEHSWKRCCIKDKAALYRKKIVVAIKKMGIYASKILIVLILFSARTLQSQNSSSESILLNSYPFREISNPIIKDDRIEKIIILSALRTGSTLMFMIFQYLFEDRLGDHMSFNNKVVKAHSIDKKHLSLLIDSNAYVVVPIRNPIDAFCSLVKVRKAFSSKQALEVLKAEISDQKRLQDTLSGVDQNRILIFKYEEFNDDFSVIFNELYRRFQLKISDEEIENMNYFFSKGSVKNYIKDFRSFSEYNPIIGVHGNHISSDRRSLEEIFPKETVEEIYRKLAPIAAFWGY